MSCLAMNNLDSKSAISGHSYKEIVDQTFEKGGHLQLAMILMLCTNAVFLGINHTLNSFHAYTPEYSCRDPGVEDACSEECVGGIEFEGNDTTIVTEWDLVCGKRYLSALVSTLYFVGVTFGTIVAGNLADLLGRKLVVFSAVIAQAVVGVSLYFVYDLYVFLVLRTLQGFLVLDIAFTMSSEFCSRKARTANGVLWNILWTVGLFYLGITAYFVRDWREFQLVITVPVIFPIIFVFFVPQSPRWLLTQNRYEDAIKICQKFDKTIQAEKVSTEILLSDDQDERSSFFDIFKSAILRKHLLICIIIFFATSLSYYGIVFFLPNLAGQRHVNFLISAAVELVAYIASYFIMRKCGQRIPIICLQFINAGVVLILGFLSVYSDGEAWADIIVMILTQIGKACAVIQFCIMYIMGCELFPTSCRGKGFGIASFFARVGSFTAPQIILLGEFSNVIAPMGIIAVFLTSGALLTFLLPDTDNAILPNTTEEAENMWKKRK